MSEAKKFRTVSKEKLTEGLYVATFEDGRSFEFDFGRFFPGFPELTEVQRGIIINGSRQKLDDCQADAGGSVDFALQRLQQVAEALNEGSWTARGESDGMSGASLTVKALMTSKNMTLADAQAQLKALVDRNLKKNEKATERQVLTAIRQHMIAVDKDFAEAYAKLQAEADARKAQNAKKLEIELD